MVTALQLAPTAELWNLAISGTVCVPWVAGHDAWKLAG